ncbi:hypothetical protein NE237_027688 [Protea cynaroides]|uniref:Uncharacterized protein n=1 Tax=Protea cynaroides TaxID=273540 RepID=A0A9Q0GMZ8_9MAGN|nr:hypothetical protein NE237_027688 [Protea cynaroides]
MVTSAPVKVPDWPKILRMDSMELMHDSDEDSAEWVPPHEYLAREYARTLKMTATSVLESREKGQRKKKTIPSLLVWFEFSRKRERDRAEEEENDFDSIPAVYKFFYFELGLKNHEM